MTGREVAEVSRGGEAGTWRPAATIDVSQARSAALSTTTRVVIAGAGGFGRDVYGWLAASRQHVAHYGICDVVFIDDRTPDIPPPAPVISSIKAYRPEPNDVVVCAVGVPAVRRAVVTGLEGVGARFHTFVDDRAILGANSSVGPGAVICPGAVLAADARVGSHVHVNMNCTIGHDVSLGEFTTLGPSVNIMGEVSVGVGAFLGGSAVVLPRISLGDSATIGAGAVVVRSVRDHDTVVGNPARSIQRTPTAHE